MKVFGVLACLLLAAGCASSTDDFAWFDTDTAGDDAARNAPAGNGTRNIVSGDSTYKGEFPHHVAIVLDGILRCGGTILDKRHVLTTASCFHQFDSSKRAYVFAGLWRFFPDSDTQTGNVQDVITHPGFDYESFNSSNIAIVRIDRDFIFNKLVQPVALTKSRDEEKILRRQNVKYENCAMVGFGVTNEETDQYPNRLRKMEGLYLRNYDTCDFLFSGNEGYLSRSQMCHFNYKKNICSADGGGALVCRKQNTGEHVVVGVAAFRVRPCTGLEPEYYATAWYMRAYWFRDWIARVIDRLENRHA